ncbi:MAG TPA: hypothetical protein VKT28_15520 [Puia sp.]|nr:hypothetical protein [Puia sp.]
MQFDSSNHIVKLCANGMELEGKGEIAEANSLFLKAWDEAANDFEKFISAHYVARNQSNNVEKLKWDETALSFALKVNDDNMKESYPSLYLNIAKCYEEMNDINNARKNYQTALSFSDFLHNNGYGRMIKSGIMKGIERMTQHERNHQY